MNASLFAIKLINPVGLVFSHRRQHMTEMGVAPPPLLPGKLLWEGKGGV